MKESSHSGNYWRLSLGFRVYSIYCTRHHSTVGSLARLSGSCNETSKAPLAGEAGRRPVQASTSAVAHLKFKLDRQAYLDSLWHPALLTYMRPLRLCTPRNKIAALEARGCTARVLCFGCSLSWSLEADFNAAVEKQKDSQSLGVLG